MTVVIKYWRESLIIIFGIIIFMSVRSCQYHVDGEKISIHKQDSAYTVIKKHELKNGELANQVQVHEVTIDQLKNDLGLSANSIKNLKSQIGSMSNLVGYWKAKASIRDTFTTTLHDTVYADSKGIEFKGKSFEWNKSKYLSLEGFIPTDFTSIQIAYKYNLDFTLVTYRKPRPFADYLKFKFGKTPLVADLTFSDPNIIVQKFSGVIIKEEPKKFYQTTLFKVCAGVVIGKLIFK